MGFRLDRMPTGIGDIRGEHTAFIANQVPEARGALWHTSAQICEWEYAKMVKRARPLGVEPLATRKLSISLLHVATLNRLVELREQSAAPDELVVAADLHNLAGTEDKNPMKPGTGVLDQKTPQNVFP
jgi:hypothetical protein